MLALLTSALALLPATAQTAPLTAEELLFEDGELLFAPVNPDTVDEAARFFSSSSLLTIEVDGKRTHFQVANNPSDTHRINGSLTLYACDGSVIQLIDACDGSVRDVMDLSLAATFNPSITMGGAFNRFLDTPWDFGVYFQTANPFSAGTDLAGMIDMAFVRPSAVIIDGVFIPDDPTKSVTRNDNLDMLDPSFDFYFAGYIDGQPDYRGRASGAVSHGGEFTEITGPILGTCPFCTTSGGLVAFKSPGQTRTEFQFRFTFEEGTPVPLPLPATVWLVLGGLGALGLTARRRRPLALHSALPERCFPRILLRSFPVTTTS